MSDRLDGTYLIVRVRGRNHLILFAAGWEVGPTICGLGPGPCVSDWLAAVQRLSSPEPVPEDACPHCRAVVELAFATGRPL